jgi:GIY-YIG catalytic domain
MAKRIPLVCQRLENVSREVLKKHQEIIRDYVRGWHGVYAIYKGDRLYYVGLASNLKGRLGSHLSVALEETYASIIKMSGERCWVSR